MAYRTVSLSTAKALVTNIKSLTDEIAELEKDKKQKAKVKALKKNWEAKGAKIDGVLVKIIADTRKEFLKHAALVDKCLGAAERKMKEMKPRLKAFLKDPNHEDFRFLMQAPREIDALAEAAKDDSNEFGTSWFELRGLNWTGKAYGLPEKFNKNFYKDRFKLMGDAKGVVTKTRKMERLAEQAAILANDARAYFASNGPQDQTLIEEDTRTLFEKVQKKEKGFSDAVRYQDGVTRMERLLQESPNSVDDRLLANIRSRVQDAISVNKDIKATQKVLKQELSQMVRFAKKPNAKAKKNLVDTGKLLDKFTQHAKDASEWAKAYSVLWTSANKIVKANEKAAKKSKSK